MSNIIDCHVSWGPKAASLTEEEKAAIVADVIAQGEAQDRERISVCLCDAKIAYKALLQVSRLAQTHIRDIATQSPEISKLKRQIFNAVDMALLHAGQMLPDDERDAIRKVQK